MVARAMVLTTLLILPQVVVRRELLLDQIRFFIFVLTIICERALWALRLLKILLLRALILLFPLNW